METWGWLVVYAVGLALFQLLVYRYLWDRNDSFANGVSLGTEEAEGDTSPTRTTDPRFRRLDVPQDPSVDGSCCPYCGEENEPGYTYCRNCVSPLG